MTPRTPGGTGPEHVVIERSRYGAGADLVSPRTRCVTSWIVHIGMAIGLRPGRSCPNDGCPVQMWDPASNGAYEGKHYRLAETICVPPPISAPRPPILIGGGGEKKTLRLVARYADACNLLSSTPEEVGHKLDVLRRHCEDVGRDYDEIEKTGVYNGEALRRGDLDGVVAELAPFAKLGITKVIVMPPDQNAAAWIDERCAPLVPKLAAL